VLEQKKEEKEKLIKDQKAEIANDDAKKENKANV